MSAQPEVKKSKVTECSYTGTFDSQYGVEFEGKKVLFKHSVAFENGDKGQYVCKQQSQAKFVIGQEVDYEFTDGQYPKVKPIQENKFQGGGNKRDPVAERKRSIMIVLQSSLERAMEFHTLNGHDKDDKLIDKKTEVCETMEFFAERIFRNKYLK